jgi:hypothetical protein
MIGVVLVTLLAAVPIELPLGEWRADPAIEMQDAYKWIFQATQGGEHAAPSRDRAATWLEREWNDVGPSAEGELVAEPLGTSGIVRVNIRSYRAAGGTEDALLTAFLVSASSFKADPVAFRRLWEALGGELRQAPIGQLTRATWEQLDAECRALNYPAVHHSEGYTRLRRPAYRVVTADEARKLMAALRQ